MLETRELHVRFGHVHALRGATLSAARDEVLVLIGPNGAGKSTVLNTVAGLYPSSAGQVLIDGAEVQRRTPRDMVTAGVTLVPQGRRLFTSMSVRENLELGAFLRADRRSIDDDIRQWSAFFPEVGSRLGVAAGSLSGGQQQIVAIIRGLMSKPRMLMLDEPSIGLAPIVVHRIGQEIRRLNRESGIGIVMVEQNVQFALDVADRIAILAQGRVAYTGPPSPLRDPGLLANYFFGEAAAAGGKPVPEDLEAIRRLIALYGQLLDDRRFEAWGELFCDEAEFLSIPGSALPGGTGAVSLQGRATIVKTVSAVQEQLAAIHPVIHFGGNPVIDVAGDRASAWWDFLVMYLKPGGTEIAHAGRYYADIVRRDSRWRFLRRASVRPGYPMPPEVNPTPAE